MNRIEAGTRIRLLSMDDPYAPVPVGTLGTVRLVDSTGTIHVAWDNGSQLGIIPGEDQFQVLKNEDENQRPQSLKILPDQGKYDWIVCETYGYIDTTKSTRKET